LGDVSALRNLDKVAPTTGCEIVIKDPGMIWVVPDSGVVDGKVEGTALKSESFHLDSPCKKGNAAKH
jgi:hypothetical protein